MATRRAQKPKVVEDEKQLYVPIGAANANRNREGSDEWLQQLRGRRGVLAYREMMDNCAEVGSALLLIETLVKRAQLKVEPWNPADKEACREADFIESALEDMRIPLSQVIGEAVPAALGFGWSAHELVYKRRMGMRPDKYAGSFYSDGKLALADVAVRSNDSLDRWEFAEDGDTVGLWQTDPRVMIPIDRMLLFHVMHNKRLPEGRSILRHAYRSWHYLKTLQEMEGIVYMRGPGFPILRVPPELLSANASASERAVVAEIKKLAGMFTVNEYACMVYPAKQLEDGKFTGFDVEFKGGGNAGGMPIRTAIQDYQKQILTCLHAAFIVLGQTTTGSFSLASSLTSTFAMVVESIVKEFCEQFTRQVVWRLEYMRGVSPHMWPYLTYGDIETPDLQSIANYVSQLVMAGVIQPDDHLERRLREYGTLPEKGVPREADEGALQGEVDSLLGVGEAEEG